MDEILNGTFVRINMWWLESIKDRSYYDQDHD